MKGLRLFAGAVLVAAVGCGYHEPTPVQDVDISGNVTGPDGQPVRDVNVYFQPASAGAQPAGFKLAADGSFTGKVKEGTYTYYLVPMSEGDRRGEAILNKLPEPYKKADEKRTVKANGGKVDLKW
jgi:hypothetical protein